MDDNDTPSPRHRSRRRRGLRLLAVGMASAFGLTLAAPAAGALLPPDEAWEPVSTSSDALYQPASGYGTEYDTGTQYDPGTDYNLPTVEDDTGPQSPDVTQPAPTGEGSVPEPDAGTGSTESTGADEATTEPTGATDQTQGETEQQKAERQLREALEDVRALLSDPNSPCAQLIGRWPNNYPTGLSALDVLDLILAAQNPKHFYNSWSQTNGNAFAVGGPVGAGPAGYIELYKTFHEAAPGKQYSFEKNGQPYVVSLEDTYNTYTHDYVFELTAREFRALALLHELRHIQGTLDDKHNADFVAENDAIVDKCFPNARRTPPNQISAPQDPIELAPIDPFPTIVDSPAPPPPQDGEGNVTIGPLEGEPGYEEPPPDAPVYDPSDAEPVILGDTGQPSDPGGGDDYTDPSYDYYDGGDDYGQDYTDPGYDYGGEPGYDDPGYDYGDDYTDPGYDYYEDDYYGGGDYTDPGYDYGGGGGSYDDELWLAEEMYAY